MVKFLAAILLTVPFLANSQTGSATRHSDELIIEGTLKSMREPVDYVYAISTNGTSGKDSAKVIGNHYILKMHTEVATLITLYAKNPDILDNLKDRYMLTFISEPAVIKIVSADSISNATLSGSKAYKEYQRLEKSTQPLVKTRTKLLTEYITKKKSGNTSQIAGLQHSIDSLNEELNDFYYEYINSNPSSLLKPYLLAGLASQLRSKSSNEKFQKLQLVYDELSAIEKASGYGKAVKNKIESNKIGVGMMAPVFSQADTSGIDVSLTSFRGQYVLLDFWASWCAPCRNESPNLVKAFNKYKTKGFNIISVSLDRADAKEKWLEAIHKDNLNWTHVSDLKSGSNEVALLYKVIAIPENFLIDPSGKIIAKNLRGTELEQKLQQLLN